MWISARKDKAWKGKEKILLLDLAAVIFLLWKISLPCRQQKLHICFHCFFWDALWKASTEIIRNKIIMFQCEMHKLKQAVVFWALSKAPFSAVLSLCVGSNGKRLLAAMFAGHRIFSFQIAEQGTVKQSSIIPSSLLNNPLRLPPAVPM